MGSPTPRGRQRVDVAGFTLVELLVVVAVIGVILAVAAVNLMPTDAEAARREASAVALSLERSRDAAWFGGRATGVSFEKGRLHAWRHAGDRWQDDPSHDTALASDLRVIALNVDGQPIDARSRVIFLADGMGSPFEVALELRGYGWLIDGDAAGAITMTPR
jgi:general secretion pathway protein H